MGAWDQLDTEITVNYDTTDIDNALSKCDKYFLDELVEELSKTKKGIEKAGKESSKDIAVRNRSFQQQLINDVGKHPYSTGMLGSSITEEQKDDFTWLVGTRINHIYPMAVEYGRKEVYPIRAKSLAFYLNTGELIFAKKAGKAKPRPFVAPAYDKTSAIAEELVLRYIGRNTV